MKRLCLILLVIAALFPLYQFCEKETAGFSVAKIAHAAKEKASVRDFPLQVSEILDQKFHYLSQGGQAFVFVSEDGQYVLKFLRRRYCPDFLLGFPLPKFLKMAVEKKQAYVQKKWTRDARSYLLAQEELRDETGLICVHLNQTSFGYKVKLVDKLNITHNLDIDQTAFLLQKKAVPILTYLEWQIAKNQIEEAKKTLDQILALVLLRLGKKIIDEDLHLDKNLGFLEGKPIFIDVGRFKKQEGLTSPEETREYLFALTARLKNWLGGQDPDLATYLAKAIHDLTGTTNFEEK